MKIRIPSCYHYTLVYSHLFGFSLPILDQVMLHSTLLNNLSDPRTRNIIEWNRFRADIMGVPIPVNPDDWFIFDSVDTRSLFIDVITGHAYHPEIVRNLFKEMDRVHEKCTMNCIESFPPANLIN